MSENVETTIARYTKDKTNSSHSPQGNATTSADKGGRCLLAAARPDLAISYSRPWLTTLNKVLAAPAAQFKRDLKNGQKASGIGKVLVVLTAWNRRRFELPRMDLDVRVDGFEELVGRLSSDDRGAVYLA